MTENPKQNEHHHDAKRWWLFACRACQDTGTRAFVLLESTLGCTTKLQATNSGAFAGAGREIEAPDTAWTIVRCRRGRFLLADASAYAKPNSP